MANLTWWKTRASTRTLRRDIDDILEEFEPPGGFRRELDRLLDAGLSTRALRREMDRLFDEFVSPAPLRRRLARRLFDDFGSRAPLRWRLTRLLDRIAAVTGLARFGRETFTPESELLSERKDAYVVRFDLTGVRESDIDVRLDGDTLVISGERRHEELVELPRGVDTSRIEATHHDGVLEVRIPKREPPRMRRVPIRSQHGRELDGRDGARVPSARSERDGGSSSWASS
jgi:HSP20 family protein